MTEEATETTEDTVYKHGDVVWVKLQYCWWPGEVVEFDQVPADVKSSFRSPPLVVVRFFQEDTYEYIKRGQDKNICLYNSTQKNDFIKKGMELVRRQGKDSVMGKFPADVCTAEKQIDGNPNILNDPMFEPEVRNKANISLIFGGTKTKRKSGGTRGRKSSLEKWYTPSPKKKKVSSEIIVTHPRFISQSNDDHEVIELIQVQKPSDTLDETIYKCTMCTYETTRIDVFVFHKSSHNQKSTYRPKPSTSPRKRAPNKKKVKKPVMKMPRSKTSTFEEDLELIRQGLPIVEDESSEDEYYEALIAASEAKSKKRNKQKAAKSPKTPKTPKSGKKDGGKEKTVGVMKKVDCQQLVAEWNDVDSEEEAEELKKKEASEKKEEGTEKSDKDWLASCFDFTEEEESDVVVKEKKVVEGNDTKGEEVDKIVVETTVKKTDETVKENDKEKPEEEIKENQSENVLQSKEIVVEEPKDITKTDPTTKLVVQEEQPEEKTTTEVEHFDSKTDNGHSEESSFSKNGEPELEKTADLELDSFEDILQSTAVPALPEVPQLQKCEQNFHNTKTIKFPDKSVESTSLMPSRLCTEVATKLTNPKKRFVKSFEEEKAKVQSRLEEMEKEKCLRGGSDKVEKKKDVREEKEEEKDVREKIKEIEEGKNVKEKKEESEERKENEKLEERKKNEKLEKEKDLGEENEKLEDKKGEREETEKLENENSEKEKLEKENLTEENENMKEHDGLEGEKESGSDVLDKDGWESIFSNVKKAIAATTKKTESESKFENLEVKNAEGGSKIELVESNIEKVKSNIEKVKSNIEKVVSKREKVKSKNKNKNRKHGSKKQKKEIPVEKIDTIVQENVVIEKEIVESESDSKPIDLLIDNVITDVESVSQSETVTCNLSGKSENNLDTVVKESEEICKVEDKIPVVEESEKTITQDDKISTESSNNDNIEAASTKIEEVLTKEEPIMPDETIITDVAKVETNSDKTEASVSNLKDGDVKDITADFKEITADLNKIPVDIEQKEVVIERNSVEIEQIPFITEPQSPIIERRPYIKRKSRFEPISSNVESTNIDTKTTIIDTKSTIIETKSTNIETKSTKIEPKLVESASKKNEPVSIKIESVSTNIEPVSTNVDPIIKTEEFPAKTEIKSRNVVKRRKIYDPPTDSPRQQNIRMDFKSKSKNTTYYNTQKKVENINDIINSFMEEGSAHKGPVIKSEEIVQSESQTVKSEPGVVEFSKLKTKIKSKLNECSSGVLRCKSYSTSPDIKKSMKAKKCKPVPVEIKVETEIVAEKLQKVTELVEIAVVKEEKVTVPEKLVEEIKIDENFEKIDKTVMQQEVVNENIIEEVVMTDLVIEEKMIEEDKPQELENIIIEDQKADDEIMTTETVEVESNIEETNIQETNIQETIIQETIIPETNILESKVVTLEEPKENISGFIIEESKPAEEIKVLEEVTPAVTDFNTTESEVTVTVANTDNVLNIDTGKHNSEEISVLNTLATMSELINPESIQRPLLENQNTMPEVLEKIKVFPDEQLIEGQMEIVTLTSSDNLTEHAIQTTCGDNVVMESVPENVVETEVSENVIETTETLVEAFPTESVIKMSENVLETGIKESVIETEIAENVVETAVAENIVETEIAENVETVITENVTETVITENVIENETTENLIETAIAETVVESGITESYIENEIVENVVETGFSESVIATDAIETTVKKDDSIAEISNNVVEETKEELPHMVDNTENVLVNFPEEIVGNMEVISEENVVTEELIVTTESVIAEQLQTDDHNLVETNDTNNDNITLESLLSSNDEKYNISQHQSATQESTKDSVIEDLKTLLESKSPEPLQESVQEEVISTEEITVSTEEIPTTANDQIEEYLKEEVVDEPVRAESNVEESVITDNPVDIESEMAKLTDTQIESTLLPVQKDEGNTQSKLLEILSEPKPALPKQIQKLPVPTEAKLKSTIVNQQFLGKKQIYLNRGNTNTNTKTGNKIGILSDQIIKPARSESDSVVVQKLTNKRTFEDFEDIDAFIIQKPGKKQALGKQSDEVIVTKSVKKAQPRSKPRILQQTIISPAGDIIQPQSQTTQAQADQDLAMFDINSMPIVLSDQILTAESLENMPIMIQESPTSTISTVTVPPKQINPIKTSTQQAMKILNKSQTTTGGVLKASPKPISSNVVTPNRGYQKPQQQQQKVNLQQLKGKLVQTAATSAMPANKGSKYILVPSMTSTTTTSPAVNKPPTVAKRPAIKRPGQQVLLQSSQNVGKIQPSVSTEPTGNKIMIVTNNLGQQSRVLLTPAQQKMFGYQASGPKVIKAGAKTTKTIKPPNILSHNTVTTKGPMVTSTNTIPGQTYLSLSTGQVITPLTQHQMKTASKVEPIKAKLSTKLFGNSPKIPGQTRTVLIKNNQGHTVKKIHATDDADLEQQVAEQLEAINRASAKAAQVEQAKEAALKLKTAIKKPVQLANKPAAPPRKSFTKKVTHTVTKSLPSTTNVIHQQAIVNKLNATSGVPPLTPLAAKRPEISTIVTNPEEERQVSSVVQEKDGKEKRQLVMQDDQGNLSAIPVGQILAIPNETTVDGQAQSYMLVTMDESGNLTALNNEALMSLDPNILGNMVLQNEQETALKAAIDNKQAAAAAQQQVVAPLQPITSQESVIPQQQVDVVPQVEIPPQQIEVPQQQQIEVAQQQIEIPPAALTNELSLGDSSTLQTFACNMNHGDINKQLLITGDPVATQKFLDSLTEGNSDLAQLLANAEGNILIQADGQQILINTTNATETDNQLLMSSIEATNQELEVDNRNPVLSKSTDILAAALADTDVLPTSKAQLSPSLYPMNIGTVETSTMSSPIMTPLEVPSSNSKKIDDILGQVTKNVDLPITITDPNISHTVSHQLQQQSCEIGLLGGNELPVSSAEMGSSFVYSLPTLDEDISQKSFGQSISMPLLTEEPEEVTVVTTAEETVSEDTDKTVTTESEDNYSLVNRICSSLSSNMCSSLSEPPPDMFDYSTIHTSGVNDVDLHKQTKGGDDLFESHLTSQFNSPSTNTDDSCEIPVQPQIVTEIGLKISENESSTNNKRGMVEESDDCSQESKKCKKMV